MRQKPGVVTDHQARGRVLTDPTCTAPLKEEVPPQHTSPGACPASATERTALACAQTQAPSSQPAIHLPQAGPKTKGGGRKNPFAPGPARWTPPPSPAPPSLANPQPPAPKRAAAQGSDGAKFSHDFVPGQFTIPHTWSTAMPSQEHSLIHSPTTPEHPLGATNATSP